MKLRWYETSCSEFCRSKALSGMKRNDVYLQGSIQLEILKQKMIMNDSFEN